jgi:hypothetical protein
MSSIKPTGLILTQPKVHLSDKSEEMGVTQIIDRLLSFNWRDIYDDNCIGVRVANFGFEVTFGKSRGGLDWWGANWSGIHPDIELADGWEYCKIIKRPYLDAQLDMTPEVLEAIIWRMRETSAALTCESKAWIQAH